MNLWDWKHRFIDASAPITLPLKENIVSTDTPRHSLKREFSAAAAAAALVVVIVVVVVVTVVVVVIVVVVIK